jgi:hypothetical protein
VLREAQTTLTPTHPKADIVLMVCLLLGTISGVCCVLLAEIFDQSFHTTKQATRALGLPVLESIDEIITAADRARLFRRRVLFAPLMVFCLLSTALASNALAYLNLKRPHTYHRVIALPREVWAKVAAGGTGAKGFEIPPYVAPDAPPRPPARLVRRGPMPAPQVPRIPIPMDPTVTGRNLIDDFATLTQRVGHAPPIPMQPPSDD